MNSLQVKIARLESRVSALEELLKVSEESFLKEAKELEKANLKLQNSVRGHEKLENDIKQILEAASDAIRVIDTDYNIVYSSKSFSRFAGHQKNPVGKKCYEAAPEKECFTGKCSLKRIIKGGKKFSFERAFKLQDGKEVFYHVDVIPYTDSGGKLLGIIKNYRDITEEKEIKKRLKEEISKHERLEKEYRMLFDSSADAIMIHDWDGYIDCNKATLELFGLSSKKELVGKHPRDFSPEIQACGQTTELVGTAHVRKAYEEGSESFEWVHLRKDGTPFYADILLSRTMYQGKVVLQSTVRDISERKEAEKRLAEEIRERERIAERYRILFEDSNDAIMLHDEKRFIDCNKATLKLLGYSRKQFLELGPADVSPPEQPDGGDSSILAGEHMKAALRSGMERFEWTCRRKDGSVIPVEIMLSRMGYQDNVMLLAIIRDITEQKRAEEEIRHINAVQKLILENSTLGIALLKNRVFEWVNGRVGELLRMPVDKIRGTPVRAIFSSEENSEKFDATVYPVLAEGKRSDNVLELRRGDGSLFRGRLIGKALEPKDVHGGSVWLLEDMTEEMQARKLAEENAQHKGRIEMANNVLHDIGNAMTGISTQVLKPQMEKNWPELQSLRRLHNLFLENSPKLGEVLGKDKQEALDRFIDALISSLEQKNAQYLEFSEKISGAVGHVCSVLELQRHYLKEKTTPLATDINIANMISDTLVMMAGSLSKRNIKVDFDIHGGKPEVSGDQTRLIRVFLNIIKNVCEAFDERESAENRTLAITVSKDERKKEISIVFSDNAVGLTRKMLQKVFARGFTTKKDGSGIGLHECRSIVESHGGSITMESNGLNTGASTIVTFPCLQHGQNAVPRQNRGESGG